MPQRFSWSFTNQPKRNTSYLTENCPKIQSNIWIIFWHSVSIKNKIFWTNLPCLLQATDQLLKTTEDLNRKALLHFWQQEIENSVFFMINEYWFYKNFSKDRDRNCKKRINNKQMRDCVCFLLSGTTTKIIRNWQCSSV